MSPSARRRHVRCRSLLPNALLGAATAAPRRSVACEAGVQVNARSVRATTGSIGVTVSLETKSSYAPFRTYRFAVPAYAKIWRTPAPWSPSIRRVGLSPIRVVGFFRNFPLRAEGVTLAQFVRELTRDLARLLTQSSPNPRQFVSMNRLS